MAKVHIRANKVSPENGQVAYAFCASVMDASGKVRPNARLSYRCMASEIMNAADFAKHPVEEQCSHCRDVLRQRRARYPGRYAIVFEGAQPA